jgi:hypothetical protein
MTTVSRPGRRSRRRGAAAGSPDPEHDRLLLREVLASALYLTLVLLAALVAVPADRLPSESRVVWIILGTAAGLLAAHWLAFRLVARLTTEQGGWSPSAAQEAGAQLTGGMAVAVLASVPFVLLDGDVALTVTLRVLAALPGLVGCLIARLRGRSWRFAVATGAVTLVLAAVVVVLKNVVTH